MPSTRRFAAIDYGCCTDLAPAVGYIDTARYLDVADALLSIWDQAMLLQRRPRPGGCEVVNLSRGAAEPFRYIIGHLHQ